MSQLASNVGLLLQRGQKQEAENLLTSTLENHSGAVEAAELLAALWTNEGRWDDAQQVLENQIAVATPPAARLHQLLGDVLRGRGFLADARSEYETALKIDPLCSAAALGLASGGDEKTNLALVKQLESTLADVKENGQCKSELHFAVARLYNNLSDFAAAFHHYELANTCTGKKIQYTFNAAFVDESRSVFSRKFFKSHKGFGHDSRLPVFIVGMPRSGTTLLEQQLARHPDIAGMGELAFIDAITQSISASNRSPTPYPRSTLDISRQHAHEYGRRYVQNVGAQLPGDKPKRSIDKAPLNFRHLGLMHLILPRARVINIQRHPIDTCLSCYFQAFFSPELSFSQSLEHCAEYYLQYRRILKHWEQVLPNQILKVEYQSLVEHPEATLKKTLEFCGLPWSENCLGSGLQNSVIRTASASQARQPIYRSSLTVRENYAAYVDPLQQRLAKYL